jgi:hypothetical protein
LGELTNSEIVPVNHHLAVLDEDGIIIFVNKAWRQFADANGLVWNNYGVGKSYLDVCECADGDSAIEAHEAFEGIHGVMANKQKEWSLEYPCHSPTEHRWFFMYVFKYEDNCDFHTAVIHMNITGRKRGEHKLRNLCRTL